MGLRLGVVLFELAVEGGLADTEQARRGKPLDLKSSVSTSFKPPVLCDYTKSVVFLNEGRLNMPGNHRIRKPHPFHLTETQGNHPFLEAERCIRNL